MQAVILAGGYGTRLRGLAGDRPKPLVPVAGRPFLDYMLDFLAANGVHRVVLAVHFRADAVQDQIGVARAGIDVSYSYEEHAMGTGGAVKLAAAQLAEDTVLVLNGDSFAAVDLSAMTRVHRAQGGPYTMLCVEVPDVARYGRIELDPKGRIIRFEEKGGSGPGLVNAGVYLLEPSVIRAIPQGQSSLERDVLPSYLGQACGVVTTGFFIDIGVPADYQRLLEDPEPFLIASKVCGE